jgi:hypothetical protein
MAFPLFRQKINKILWFIKVVFYTFYLQMKLEFIFEKTTLIYSTVFYVVVFPIFLISKKNTKKEETLKTLSFLFPNNFRFSFWIFLENQIFVFHQKKNTKWEKFWGIFNGLNISKGDLVNNTFEIFSKNHGFN